MKILWKTLVRICSVVGAIYIVFLISVWTGLIGGNESCRIYPVFELLSQDGNVKAIQEQSVCPDPDKSENEIWLEYVEDGSRTLVFSAKSGVYNEAKSRGHGIQLMLEWIGVNKLHIEYPSLSNITYSAIGDRLRNIEIVGNAKSI